MDQVTGRVCKNCNKFFDFKFLVKKSDCKYGYKPQCIGCKNINQKAYRENNQNIQTKKYEKTPNGYLVRTYRNMKSRVTGIQRKKAHLYEGLELLSKEEFYSWSLSSNFLSLLENYRNSGYDKKLSPSIDRIDPTKGYTLDNIRWITHSMNSKLGAINRHGTD